MEFCRRQLSAYQRRSMRTIETMMGVCIALNILLQTVLERHHLKLVTRWGIALLSIAPVIGTDPPGSALSARGKRRVSAQPCR
jgi:hypothetical protein